MAGVNMTHVPYKGAAASVVALISGESQLTFTTVLIATVVAAGGRSNWYKGVQLLTIYLIFAILFFLLPGK